MSEPSSTAPDVHVLLQFRAGRCAREGKNRIRPLPGKGTLILCEDPNLSAHVVHWIPRSSGDQVTMTDADAESYVVMKDAKLELVPKSVCHGRVVVLRYLSHDATYFFWLQDKSEADDETIVSVFNELLDMGEEKEEEGGATTHQNDTSHAAITPDDESGGILANEGAVESATRQSVLSQWQAALSQMAASSRTPPPRSQAQPPNVHLLLNLFTRREVMELLKRNPHVFEDIKGRLLPVSSQTEEFLLHAIGSTSFRDGVLALRQALYSDQAPVLFATLGANISALENTSDPVVALMKAISQSDSNLNKNGKKDSSDATQS